MKLAGLILRSDNQRGSVLVAALVVIFILLTIFFAVFSIAVSSKMMITKRILHTRAAYLADAGIERFLFTINRDSLSWQSAIELLVLDSISESESFQVDAKLYGGYLMVTSKGRAGSQSVLKRALIGKAPWPELNNAVINGDLNYPLVMAGRTKVNGNVLTGPEGVVRGSLRGETGEEANPVSGSVETRQTLKAMTIDHDYVARQLQEISVQRRANDNILSGSQVMHDIKLDKSDSDVTYLIEGDLELQDFKLDLEEGELNFIVQGNVTVKGGSDISGALGIYSAGSITFDGPSTLDGALCFAEDSIIFRKVERFSGQALAGVKIEVGEKAGIEYPSLLYLFATENTRDTSQIHFEPKNRSRTIAVIEKRPTEDKEQIDLIHLDSTATVTGCLASENITSLRGTLKGISITASFGLEIPPTKYVNWLYNTSIDRTRLDFLPVMPVSLNDSKQYAVFDLLGE